MEFHFTHIDADDTEKVFGLALKIRPDKTFSGQWQLLQATLQLPYLSN